jgi:hypothetical protein
MEKPAEYIAKLKPLPESHARIIKEAESWSDEEWERFFEVMKEAFKLHVRVREFMKLMP